MRGSRLVAAGCAALALAGCDLTLPWRDGSAPDAPSGFVASEGFDFDSVGLSWSPQAGIDAFELEGRMAWGPWQSLDAAIPPDTVGGTLTFDPTVPELTQFAFRLRARSGSFTSGWVEAPFLRGVRPPSSVTAEVATQSGWRTGPITVGWTNASQVATDVAIERSRNGFAETWVPLAGATLAAGTHLDRLVEDGASYTYRVRVGAGGVWSEPATAWTWPIDLAAPWALEAEVVTSGVQLGWTNQSTTATSAAVSAWVVEWNARTIPVDALASAAFDPGEPVWPATWYQVTIERGFVQARSNLAHVAPFTLAGPPPLAASWVHLPAAGAVARGAEGGFHVTDTYGGVLRIHRALPGGGHESHDLADGWSLLPPGIALDGSGHPHAVFTRLVGSGIVDVAHEWWTGAAWDSEVVLTAVSTSWVDPTFAAGSGGALHLVYEPSPGPVVHVLRAGGVTTAMDVPATSAPAGFSCWRLAFGVGPDGTAFVAQAGFGSAPGSGASLVVSTRSPDGTWTDETLPVAVNLSCLSLAPGSGGDVALAFCADDVAYDDDVWVVERRQGAWSSPELVVGDPSGGYGFDLVFAGAPDLSRLVLSLGNNQRPAALLVRGDAGWESVEVGPTPAQPFLGAGPSGAWALYGHTSFSASGGPFAYSLFEEIP